MASYVERAQGWQPHPRHGQVIGAEVDVAFWARADQYGMEGWRANDSYPGHMIEYADPELKCWMALPSANAAASTVADMPTPWEGSEEELHGSGI